MPLILLQTEFSCSLKIVMKFQRVFATIQLETRVGNLKIFHILEYIIHIDYFNVINKTSRITFTFNSKEVGYNCNLKLLQGFSPQYLQHGKFLYAILETLRIPL